jgi:hypothetical protein
MIFGLMVDQVGLGIAWVPPSDWCSGFPSVRKRKNRPEKTGLSIGPGYGHHFLQGRLAGHRGLSATFIVPDPDEPVTSGNLVISCGSRP